MYKSAKVRMNLQVIPWRKKHLDPLVYQRLKKATALLLDEVRTEVSKPGPEPSKPGEPPRRQSGAYKRSLESATDFGFGGDWAIGRVGSNSHYARRLELGFVGTDSLGRNYNQLPRPHFRPVHRRLEGRIARIIVKGD